MDEGGFRVDRLNDAETFRGPDAAGGVGPFAVPVAQSDPGEGQRISFLGPETGTRVRDHISTTREELTIRQPAWPGWCNGPGRT